MRRSMLLVLATVLTAVLAPPARAADVTVIVADGRGRGHGVGMAQDGAFAMGEDGATMDQILDHFFPGVGRGSTTGTARIVVHVANDGRAELRFPDGGELRSPRSGPQHRGFPVRLGPGASVVIERDGAAYVADVPPAEPRLQSAQLLPTTSTTSSTTTTSTSSTTTTTTGPLLPLPSAPTTTTTTAPPGPGATTTTTAPPSGSPGPAPAPTGRRVSSLEPIWAGPVADGATIEVAARRLRYRGELEVGGDPLRVVNELDVEQYLWGLGEVSSAWSPASLRAQIVAARTYALRAMRANGEICDTQRCQVYKGASGEFPQQVAAVNDTLGTVLTWNGGYASTVYSANAAGMTATPSEGFGNPDASHPYLPAVAYTSRSEVRFDVRIGLDDLARRVGYPGTATAARVATTGPSGRPLTVEIDGSDGVRSIPAIQVQRAMGLQSTQWTLRSETAAVAPEAPDAADVVQAAPDDVATAVASEVERMRARDARSDARSSDASSSAADAAGGSDAGDDDDGLDPLAWPLLVAILAAGAVGFGTLRRGT